MDLMALSKWTTELPVFTPQAFGAKGDGVSNDHDAFLALGAAVTKTRAGRVVIPPGTYVVGRQTFAGTTGLNYSYLGENVLTISGCNGLRVEGPGAVLKVADGQRFGAFDPVTGEPHIADPAPHGITDYRASLKRVVSIESCTDVVIDGLDIDGNQPGLVIGGDHGDYGIQLNADGLYIGDCRRVWVKDVSAHHHGRDGVFINGPSAYGDAAHEMTFENLSCTYNGRQGVTLAGGIGLTFNDCDFSHQGRSRTGSPPQSGIDSEPDQYKVEKVVCNRCTFVNNTGVQFKTFKKGDSRDFEFNHCIFDSSTRETLEIRTPNTRFFDCEFRGGATRQTYDDATSFDDPNRLQFTRCLFTDAYTDFGRAPITLNTAGHQLHAQASFVTYDACVFENPNYASSGRRYAFSHVNPEKPSKLTACTVLNHRPVAKGTVVAQMHGTTLEKCRFGGVPGAGGTFQMNNATIVGNDNTIDDAHEWGSGGPSGASILAA